MWIEYDLFNEVTEEQNVGLINSALISNIRLSYVNGKAASVFFYGVDCNNTYVWCEGEPQPTMKVFNGFKSVLLGQTCDLDEMGYIRFLSTKKHLDECFERGKNVGKQIMSPVTVDPIQCNQCGKKGGHGSFEVCFGRNAC